MPQTESYSPFHSKVFSFIFFFKYIYIYIYYIQCISYAYFEIQIRKVMRKLLLDNFSKFSSSKLPLVKLTFLNRIFAPVQCHHHPPKWPLHSHIDTLKNNEVQGYNNSNFLHGNILMKKVVLWCFLMSEKKILNSTFWVQISV